MRVILENQDEEFLTYCDDYKEESEELRAARRSAIRKIHAEMIRLFRVSEEKTRKEFALMTQNIKGPERNFLFECFELQTMSEDFDDWAHDRIEEVTVTGHLTSIEYIRLGVLLQSFLPAVQIKFTNFYGVAPKEVLAQLNIEIEEK